MIKAIWKKSNPKAHVFGAAVGSEFRCAGARLVLTHICAGKLYLIKLFTEAEVRENYVAARIQQNILKFQVPIDDAELQEGNKAGRRNTRRDFKRFPNRQEVLIVLNPLITLCRCSSASTISPLYKATSCSLKRTLCTKCVKSSPPFT